MNQSKGAFVSETAVLAPLKEGLLSGLTFAVKDVFDIANYKSSAGNPDWLRTHEPAAATSTAVEQLLKAGASMQGTTITDELMFSLDGQNIHYGTPLNPKAPDRIPGGSSSGSASAVASGSVDFALGTDTGGSVRIPSAYCGIYGMRPTHDLISAEGVIPLARSFDTVGWMARDAETLYAAGKVLVGEAVTSGSHFHRMLFAREAWDGVDAACLQVLNRARAAMAEEMGQSEWVSIAPEGLQQWMTAFRMIQGIEIWEEHGEWITEVKPAFGPGIAQRFEWASTLKKENCEEMLLLRNQVKDRLTSLLGEDGLLVIPTAPGPAPILGLQGEESELRRSFTMQLSCIAGLAGLPQVTIPAGTVDGAPVGISVIAGKRMDLDLLEWVSVRGQLWEDVMYETGNCN